MVVEVSSGPEPQLCCSTTAPLHSVPRWAADVEAMGPLVACFPELRGLGLYLVLVIGLHGQQVGPNEALVVVAAVFLKHVGVRKPCPQASSVEDRLGD